ncbi:MAG: LPS export ABC transporter periplasmic protein LptC [Aquisalimonadaceae bacterium]
MNRRWLYQGTVLALLVIVGWWVLDEPDRPPRSESLVEEERRPDNFTENFTILATNAQGAPAWELSAPRMVHFEDDDTWELDSPDVLYYTDAGEPWRLVAERGRAWSGLEEALLEGEVRISREAGPDNAAARLDTSEVRLWPDDRIAETDRPAVYRSAGSHVEGTGARGDFARDLLHLRSEVKARYVPHAQ